LFGNCCFRSSIFSVIPVIASCVSWSTCSIINHSQLHGTGLPHWDFTMAPLILPMGPSMT
jgi:hypothetical protein